MAESTSSTGTSSVASDTAGKSSGQRTLVITAMVFVTGMTFIDQTIVSIGAPVIEKDLGISDEAVQWIINGYLLGLAATFALMGRMADVYGHRRMVIIGTVVFAFSSLMCGLTPSGDWAGVWLIGWRFIEGVGAAMLFPAALAIVVAAFTIATRGRALALFFAITGGLTAIGPLLGGYLVEWDWRSIFWVNIPIAVIALILTGLCHVETQRQDEPIDWGGAVFTIVGMGLSVLGFQQAGTWGWESPATWGCILGGFAVLALFVRYETKQEYPLIKVHIFTDRAFQADNAVLFFLSMAFVPVFFFLSVYAQAALGYSPQESGLFLMWFFLGFVIAAQVGGALLDSRGSKPPMLLGGLIGAVGYFGWAINADSLSAGAVSPWIVVAGAGAGLMLGPASTDAVNRAINATYGEVTGITQTVRNYAAALGLAILGSIMSNQIADRIAASAEKFGLDESASEALVGSLSGQTSGGAAGAIANVPEKTQEAFLSEVPGDIASAMTWVIYGMAAVMLLAALSALRHPGGRVVAADAGSEAKETAASSGSATKRLLKFLGIFIGVAAVIYVVIWLVT